MRHIERHRTAHIGWLRAAVLGANDGLISTASLIVGVAAAGTGRGAILIAGVAGLVAGAMSMAAGEYVSVSSQADTEAADLAREGRELATDPAAELAELAGIFESRGLAPELASEVAQQLMARDAIGAHAREELGLSELTTARPLQAALSSAASFAGGASRWCVANARRVACSILGGARDGSIGAHRSRLRHDRNLIARPGWARGCRGCFGSSLAESFSTSHYVSAEAS